MKIRRTTIHETTTHEATISEFAEEHDLTLSVHEQRGPCDYGQFWVHFDDAEIKDAGCLLLVHGDGASELEAIADYAAKISSKRLVVNAYGENSREIDAPRFAPKQKPKLNVGDIVNVVDCSYSVTFSQRDYLSKKPGDATKIFGLLWRVVGVDYTFPTYRNPSCPHSKENDVMLCRANDTSRLLFTRSDFCRVL